MSRECPQRGGGGGGGGGGRGGNCYNCGEPGEYMFACGWKIGKNVSRFMQITMLNQFTYSFAEKKNFMT